MVIKINYLLLNIIFLISINTVFSSELKQEEASGGAYQSGQYPNLFSDLLQKSEYEVDAKIDQSWQQLFFGEDDQRVYYPVDMDMAYIEDINNKDVRSEGMSYGMMIAVQMDKKEPFDRLWKWAKINMQHKEGQREDYFAWSVTTKGAILDSNSASDGEEWIVTALFLAAARWGNGEGIFNYQQEAQNILDAMLNKEENSNSTTVVTNMFNKTEKQVVFVPIGNADDYTDPSYHVPHFYELWARWADKNKDFWQDAADTSRTYLKKATHPITGLSPDYSSFDGTPTDVPWGGGHDDFRFDAFRVAMNVAVDYLWFKKEPWAVTQSNRLLDFFTSEGLDSYVNQYTLDGKRLSSDRSTALIAMNAVAALAATNANRTDFVQALWDMPLPTGQYRYYDGLLQMLALLQVSGNFRIYHPTKIDHPVSPRVIKINEQ